jgi:group I intron endonuclease
MEERSQVVKAYLYRFIFPNGKSYIGITVNLAARFRSHVIAAKTLKNAYAVHAAIAKYGWSNITKEILCEGSFEYIKELEIKAIAAFKTFQPDGYNLTLGGDGATGRKVSVLEREKIKQRMLGQKYTLGRVYSDEEKANWKRWNHSEETKLKIKAAVSGKKRTPQQIKRISEGAKKRWSDPEKRKALSESCKGRKISEEAARKIALANTGKKQNNDIRIRKLTSFQTTQAIKEGRAVSILE